MNQVFELVFYRLNQAFERGVLPVDGDSLERLFLLPDERVQRFRFGRLGLRRHQRNAVPKERHVAQDVQLQVLLDCYWRLEHCSL